MAFGQPSDLRVAAVGGGAHTGALASIVTVAGFVCLFAWVAWRFGPTLLRFGGVASWWAGWACGNQGGYGYMVEYPISRAYADARFWRLTGGTSERLKDRIADTVLG